MVYTEARNRATQKYKAKAYKRIPLDLRKEDYERIKEHCDSFNIPVNTFIKNLINKELDKRES